MAGIKIDGAKGVRIENMSFHGFDVGIEGKNVGLSVKNVHFHNVGQAFDLSGSQAQISSTRISQAAGTKTTRVERNGPPLPVFCSNCKSIFGSRHYNFSGALFNLWDNEEPCINCGDHRARLSEGIFDLTKDVVRVLSAPDMTYVMLQSLNAIAADVIAGRIETGKAIEKIAALSPGLGDVARRGLTIGGQAACWVVATGIAVFSAYYAVKAANLAEAQVTIAQEQLDLQRQDAGQQDAILEEILKRLPRGDASPKVDGNDDASAREGATAEPAKSKATVKTDRLKARDLRRKAEKQRRNDLGRARHR
ncbi:hypothetical protein [Mesorhizobium sp. M0643]|uniref:hypothetical protein n=1 Tax=Mesorhizobium sp. M0643 TaxID=2956978 RepID=UPI00333C64B8